MTNNTISAEVAKEQLDSLVEYYDIDIESDDVDQARARQSACDKVIRAIRAGRLEINKETMVVVQTLKNDNKLTYRELDGKAKVEMGKRSNDDTHGKIYSLLGSLSGVGFNGITALKGKDLTLAESLGILFLLA